MESVVSAPFAVTVMAVPLWSRLLRGGPWLDQPRSNRHNRRAVSRTGGAAWLTAVLALLFLAPVLPAGGAAGAAPGFPAAPLVLAALLPAAFAIGLLDDAGRIGPGPKWMAQTLLLAGSVCCCNGATEGGACLAGLPLTWSAGAVFLLALAVQTALEIHDNMDALLAISSAAFFLSLALSHPAVDGGWLRPVSLAAGGASLGVLVFNRPPARVFFGNSGSMAVALLAALLLAGALLPATRPGAGPVPWGLALPLIWPLADLAFVTVRRLLQGRPPWRGGRDHTTHGLAAWIGDRGVAATAMAIAGLGALATYWLGWSR